MRGEERIMVVEDACGVLSCKQDGWLECGGRGQVDRWEKKIDALLLDINLLYEVSLKASRGLGGHGHVERSLLACPVLR